MATFSSILETAILSALHTKHRLTVPEIYTYVYGTIELTPEDKKLIIVSGRPTEPAWHRNVRNVLQRLKQSGSLVNQPKGYWQLPAKNWVRKLSITEAWSMVITTAKTCLEQTEIWYSPIELREYKIISIYEDSIQIERITGGDNTTITKTDIKRAVNIINATGGKATRRSLNRVVAKEAAIVFLHPQLTYDVSADSIIIDDVPINSASRDEAKIAEKEAVNDNIENFRNVLRRVRKGQSQLRNKLLQVYSSQCCVTGTGPANVLEAAHIEWHSAGGINISTNALLLRSDIHILFDDHLITIEPETMKVLVSEELIDSPYWVLNKATLRPRNDNKLPDKGKLEYHWRQTSWTSH